VYIKMTMIGCTFQDKVQKKDQLTKDQIMFLLRRLDKGEGPKQWRDQMLENPADMAWHLYVEAVVELEDYNPYKYEGKQCPRMLYKREILPGTYDSVDAIIQTLVEAYHSGVVQQVLAQKQVNVQKQEPVRPQRQEEKNSGQELPKEQSELLQKQDSVTEILQEQERVVGTVSELCRKEQTKKKFEGVLDVQHVVVRGEVLIVKKKQEHQKTLGEQKNVSLRSGYEWADVREQDSSESVRDQDKPVQAQKVSFGEKVWRRKQVVKVQNQIGPGEPVRDHTSEDRQGSIPEVHSYVFEKQENLVYLQAAVKENKIDQSGALQVDSLDKIGQRDQDSSENVKDPSSRQQLSEELKASEGLESGSGGEQQLVDVDLYVRESLSLGRIKLKGLETHKSRMDMLRRNTQKKMIHYSRTEKVSQQRWLELGKVPFAQASLLKAQVLVDLGGGDGSIGSYIARQSGLDYINIEKSDVIHQNTKAVVLLAYMSLHHVPWERWLEAVHLLRPVVIIIRDYDVGPRLDALVRWHHVQFSDFGPFYFRAPGVYNDPSYNWDRPYYLPGDPLGTYIMVGRIKN